MLRSLVFTALHELAPETRAMTSADVSELVTDGCEAVRVAQSADASVTTWAAMVEYVDNVTAHGTCDPGIWSRYLSCVRASR